jgi:hypothetical protein
MLQVRKAVLVEIVHLVLLNDSVHNTSIPLYTTLKSNNNTGNNNRELPLPRQTYRQIWYSGKSTAW